VRLSRLSLIPLLMSLTLTSGCLERQVYLEPGQKAEIARPVTVWVWVRNAETQKKELRPYVAQSGDIIGRRK